MACLVARTGSQHDWPALMARLAARNACLAARCLPCVAPRLPGGQPAPPALPAGHARQHGLHALHHAACPRGPIAAVKVPFSPQGPPPCSTGSTSASWRVGFFLVHQRMTAGRGVEGFGPKYRCLLRYSPVPANARILVAPSSARKPLVATGEMEKEGGGTNRSDIGLNLSGSWQQGHSATYNTPSRT